MNRKIPVITSLFTLLLLQLTACSPEKNHKQHEQKSRFTPGKVISRVTCLQDTNVSYALFLPKSYDPAKRYPLVIAFDAHAAGKLAVELFSAQAKLLGYIVAGSNNSKNGIALDITLTQYELMRRDILQRLSIDTNRIYTAGFSGGSRVAASVAIFNGGISGVIGCSAGFPQIDRPLTTRFSYLGVVGNADFNFSEMKALDKALEDAGFVHHLLVFDGIHAWPPSSIIPSIFTWLELDAMRRKLKPADEAYVSGIMGKYKQEIDSLHLKNRLVEEYDKCMEASQFLNGVADVGAFTRQATQLSQSAAIKKQAEEDDRLAKKETQLQQYYAEALNSQNEKWWSGEVKRLAGSAGIDIGESEQTMYKRVLSYLSLAAYMQASGALKAGDRENAGRMISIYGLVDPQNAEAPYLEAGWLAVGGNEAEALKSLAKALDLGFTDLKRIESDPAFTKIKGSPGYERIISRMKDKK